MRKLNFKLMHSSSSKRKLDNRQKFDLGGLLIMAGLADYNEPTILGACLFFSSLFNNSDSLNSEFESNGNKRFKEGRITNNNYNKFFLGGIVVKAGLRPLYSNRSLLLGGFLHIKKLINNDPSLIVEFENKGKKIIEEDELFKSSSKVNNSRIYEKSKKE